MIMTKILIIDDDPYIRELYSKEFSDAGFEVDAAENGEKALAKISEFKPNVLLLDIMMPEIHGFQLLDIVKSTPNVDKTKIVVFTALGDDQSRAKARELHADGFLVKSENTMAEVVNYVRGII